MPKITVYIRNDDYIKWKQVPNKSEFISAALNDKEPITNIEPIKQIKQPKQTNSNFTFCKNGHPIIEGRGVCFGKGCKYN